MPDEPPEGSWQMKVPLRAIPMGIGSCPMVKDEHLAVSYVEMLLLCWKL